MVTDFIALITDSRVIVQQSRAEGCSVSYQACASTPRGERAFLDADQSAASDGTWHEQPNSQLVLVHVAAVGYGKWA